MLPSELRKKLDKALFSRKDAKTKLNLPKKKYLGERKNHRRGFMVLFEVNIRTREIWSQGKDILNDLNLFNLSVLSFKLRAKTTILEVVASMLAVVCKHSRPQSHSNPDHVTKKRRALGTRMVCKWLQQLPSMLRLAVHRGKDMQPIRLCKLCVMRARGSNNVGRAVANGSNIVALCFGDHGTKEMLGVVG